MFQPAEFARFLQAEKIPLLPFAQLHDYCDPNAILLSLLGNNATLDELNAAAANWDKFAVLLSYCKGDEPVCILDSARGVYIPANFCELFGFDIPELSSPDNEDYCDFWYDLESNFSVVVDGKLWFLYHNADLFLVPEGYDVDEF